MRAVTRLSLLLSCVTLGFVGMAARAAEKPYTWSDIDCSKSRLAAWPGLKCRSTNVVTTEGNVGAFRRWAAVGHTDEGYIHLFLWEGVNEYSYLPEDTSTPEFLKWVYGPDGNPSQFSSVFRFHNVDTASFRDGQASCVGFRRTGNPRRGGYEWVQGGLMCAPLGRTVTNEQFGRFIDRAQLR